MYVVSLVQRIDRFCRAGLGSLDYLGLIGIGLWKVCQEIYQLGIKIVKYFNTRDWKRLDMFFILYEMVLIGHRHRALHKTFWTSGCKCAALHTRQY